MSTQHRVIVSHHEADSGTLKTYVSGFVLSIALTLTAYLLVTHHVFSNWTVAFMIGGLAIVQFMVQLLFFLHLGRETKPRWRVGVFLFMLLVLLIVVVGSLWIMHSLNYRMMPEQQMEKYLQEQDGGI